MADRLEDADAPAEPMRVLLVDNDTDIRELVEAILTDEGYEVSSLGSTDHDAIAAEVGRLEPDCILLDGAEEVAFGDSWASAAYLASRGRAVPTVMFTAHAADVSEARDNTSERSVAAHFAGIVPKPFAIDDLLAAVETATGRSVPFDRSEAGERERTRVLAQELRAAGATDVRTGERREWATFVPPTDERIHQLYWWQLKGVYIVGRYDADARLQLIGRFYERQAAITAAVGSGTSAPAPA